MAISYSYFKTSRLPLTVPHSFFFAFFYETPSLCQGLNFKFLALHMSFHTGRPAGKARLGDSRSPPMTELPFPLPRKGFLRGEWERATRWELRRFGIRFGRLSASLFLAGPSFASRPASIRTVSGPQARCKMGSLVLVWGAAIFAAISLDQDAKRSQPHIDGCASLLWPARCPLSPLVSDAFLLQLYLRRRLLLFAVAQRFIGFPRHPQPVQQHR
jgi:hypothetical protein